MRKLVFGALGAIVMICSSAGLASATPVAAHPPMHARSDIAKAEYYWHHHHWHHRHWEHGHWHYWD